MVRASGAKPTFSTSAGRTAVAHLLKENDRYIFGSISVGDLMYAIIAIGLMVVVPLATVGIEFALAHDAASFFYLVGKWFAFWGVGVRLLIAGINQAVRPGFTAKDIFKIADPAAETIVNELGYANIAFGLIGILSLPFPGLFLTATIVAGGLFLGLDGFLHIRSKDRNRNETIAMVTDFVVPAAGLIYLLGTYA